MLLVNRDYTIISEVHRWRYMLGRQIKEIAGFTGARAADKRLRKLIDCGFLERKRYIYGISSLYTVTQRAISYYGIRGNKSSVRIDNIGHNTAVIDTAIYFVKIEKNTEYSKIKTERELMSEFANEQNKPINPRKHFADFEITAYDGKKYGIEVELSLKRQEILEKNISGNYMKYDGQYWIIPGNRRDIRDRINIISVKYPGITILELENIQKQIYKQKEKKEV